ncbi:hypothetical protein JTE90_010610 [Oedothorax gibbosus]|uniref:Uncharacterized protein n=1 Tax=Oedothorax gibbosus TaxID=931172 RepID=A0AAV6TT13_9ARAC|nr:hypothetical protein JTE90_010610 [Oedothorax gibbosus]
MPREKRLYSSIRLSTDSSQALACIWALTRATVVEQIISNVGQGNCSEWINNYRELAVVCWIFESTLATHETQKK